MRSDSHKDVVRVGTAKTQRFLTEMAVELMGGFASFTRVAVLRWGGGGLHHILDGVDTKRVQAVFLG